MTRCGAALKPRFMVRSAGLPIDALAPFVHRELLDDADALVAAEEAARAAAERASSWLYDLVPKLESKRQRREALALKRAVQDLEGAQALQKLRTYPGKAGSPKLRELERRLVELDGTRARLRERYANACDRGLEGLQSALSDDWFVCGLLLTNPLLYRRGVRLVAKDLSCWNAREKRAFEALVAYRVRAITKVSPITTFTTVAEVEWGEEGQPSRALPPDQVTARIEVNRRWMTRLLMALHSHPEISKQALVRTNPTLHRAGGRYCYLTGSALSPGLSGRSSGPERIAKIAATPLLDQVRHVLRDVPLSRRETLTALGGANPETEALLDRLLELGFLTTSYPLCDMSPGFDAAVLGWLRAAGADLVGGLLAGMLEEVESLRTFSVPGRASGLRRLEQCAQAIEAELGIRERWRPLVYETVAGLGGGNVPGGRDLDPVLDDLSVLARASSAFDPMQVQRVTYGEFIESRWGPGAEVCFLDFYREYALALGRGATGAPGENAEAPQAAVLRRAQSRIERLIRDSAGPAGGAARINPALVRAELDDWPAPFALASEASFLLQRGEEEDAPWVVNLVGEGYGRFLSRYRRSSGGFDGWRGSDGKAPSGVTAVDLSSTFGSGAGLREPPRGPWIAYPGGEGDVGGSEVITIRDLVVRSIEGDARLLNAKTGDEVAPYNGGLLPMYRIPRLGRTLLAFGPPRPSSLPWHQLIYGTAPGYRERVFWGGLLLHRRSWRIPVSALPKLDRAGSDLDHFLALAHWSRAHEMPEEVFITWDRLDESEAERMRVNRSRAVDKFNRKPRYHHFGAPWLVGPWRKMARRVERELMVEEAYPAFAAGEPRTVVEYCVELEIGASVPHRPLHSSASTFR